MLLDILTIMTDFGTSVRLHEADKLVFESLHCLPTFKLPIHSKPFVMNWACVLGHLSYSHLRNMVGVFKILFQNLKHFALQDPTRDDGWNSIL